MTNSELEPLLRGAASEAERRLLDSALHDAPAPRARDEMLAALGVPPLDARERRVELPVRGSGGPLAYGLLVALFVGVTTGAVVLSGAASERPGEAEEQPAVRSTTNELPELPTESNRPDDADRTASAPVVTPDSLPNAPALDGPRPRASTASVEGRSRASTDALEREIALVEAARAALRRDDAEGTLGVLDGYDREFPRGAFAVEVSVLRIEALMRAGRTEEAQRLGSRFLEVHREGAFARRVRASLNVMARGAPSAEGAPARPSDE